LSFLAKIVKTVFLDQFISGQGRDIKTL